MGMEDQECPSNIESDITLASSSRTNNDDSIYVRSHKNPPVIQHTTPDLSSIIEDDGNILEVFDKGIANINSPRMIFTQNNNLNPAELVGGE